MSRTSSLKSYVFITLAPEQKLANREKASTLISDLYGQVLNSCEIASRFDQILRQLEDLESGTPDVSKTTGNFITRSVADDCLGPTCITKPQIYSSPMPLNLKKYGNL